MPENVMNEWDELRKRIEDNKKNEDTKKSRFEYKDLSE